jgi:hypothetical protein
MNVAESVVMEFDEPDVVEATRSAAANQLIELRDKMPKKYQPKINKILSTFITG